MTRISNAAPQVRFDRRDLTVRPATTRPATTTARALPRPVDAFTPARAAPSRAPVAPPPDPNQPDVNLNQLYGRTDLAQGATNSCGTTSLAIVLERMGIHIPRTQIDASIRENNFGTAIDDIVDYAHGQGLQAAAYDHGDFNTLQSQLAKGRQVMVMTDVDRAPDGKLNRGSDSDASWHYMVVTQAFTAKDGKQYVTYQNPWGVQQTVPYERFDKLWKDLKLLGMPSGYDHTYILLDKKGAAALPPAGSGFDMAAANDLMHGLTSVSNGYADLTNGRIAQGVGRLVGGVLGSLTGIPANLLAVGGRYINDAGSAMSSKADELMGQDSWLSKVGGGLLKGASWVTTGVGTVTNAVGNAVGAVGNAISSGIEKVGSWLGSLF